MKKIICDNSYHCFISGIEKDNKPVLSLDFQIKHYSAMSKFVPHAVDKTGWTKIDLPPNAIIHDKLYLGETQIKQVFELFDEFIETTYLSTGSNKKTSRGFNYSELTDIYQNTISIQESSSVNAKIWFGLDNVDKYFVFQNNTLQTVEFSKLGLGSIVVEDRLHLTISLAKQMKKYMKQEWEQAFILSERKNLHSVIEHVASSKTPIKPKI